MLLWMSRTTFHIAGKYVTGTNKTEENIRVWLCFIYT